MPNHTPTSRTTLLQSTRFEVEGRTFAGIEQRRDVVLHPGAAVILPMLDPETYLMIRNWRFSVEKTLWELPAGILEPDESPEQTAHRELIEETGYEAKILTPLTSFYTSPGFCNEIIHAYVATNLHYIGQNLDDSEEISVEKVSTNQAIKMIQTGDLQDAKSMIAIFYHQQLSIYTS